MSEERTSEVRRRLDDELSLGAFERERRPTEAAAAQFFRDLFVGVLGFEATSPSGDAAWPDVPLRERGNAGEADARLLARAGDFRVVYAELEGLTRTAERDAVRRLARSDRTGDWATEGSFLAVFHAPDEGVWHLVTPYEDGTDDVATGRPVLRRYALGEGETHRTVAGALASTAVGADEGTLADRVDEAFRVEPVTEEFYESYRSAFDALGEELRGEGLRAEDADRYAHVTLTRLLFVYYLQKKEWFGGRKDFVRWFHDRYEETDGEGGFHERWLSALFFGGMTQPRGESIDADLPGDVESALSGLPYLNEGLFRPTEEDETDVFLSDSALRSVVREFLERYSFTVTEESPYDVDVAVDPAMLGKIYESLIAGREREEAGVFYTPRAEVDLMCRLALYEQFCAHVAGSEERDRRRVVEFLFAEPGDWEPETAERADALRETLRGLRVVDPACGSGAFLVGMKQVLTELYGKLGVERDYDLVERIVDENLSGVDVNGWAVRVAEFRLWLSLVEGEAELPRKRPVLPSFTFTLRTGDSLVQKVGDARVSTGAHSRPITDEAEDVRNGVRRLKERQFERGADLRERIREKETELLRTRLDGRIERLENRTDRRPPGGETRSESDVDARIAELRSLRRSVDDPGENDFLAWDIDFSDVMLEGGFDVVIGNPPYVAHQELVPQEVPRAVRAKFEEGDAFDAIEDAYRAELRGYCERAWGCEPYEKSDLYLYFFFRGLDLLCPTGTLTYMTSNAWLDVGYGKRLQAFLLEEGDVSTVVDTRRHRVFDEADVNTTITVVQNATEAPDDRNPETHFLELESAYSEIVGSASMVELLDVDADSGEGDYAEGRYLGETFGVRTRERFRDIAVSRKALWRLGDGSVSVRDGSLSGRYRGNMWGALFHRAPDSFFAVTQEASDDFVELPKANIETYLNTGGADDFFFVDVSEEESANPGADGPAGDETVNVRAHSGDRFEVESEYVVPFLESPREIDSLRVTRGSVESHLLAIPGSVERTDLEEESVWDYIQWGEEQGFHEKSGRRRGERWEILPDQAYGTSRILVGCYMDQPRVFHNPDEVISHRFFRVCPGERDAELLAASMNSAVTLLSYELFRNPGLGGGVLAVSTDSVSRFLVVDPAELDLERRTVRSFLSRRQETIRDEIGLNPGSDIPLSRQEPTPKPDRTAIDDAVFEAIGASETVKKDVYRSLVALTHSRRSEGDTGL